jgi:hypothetical protein
MPDGALGPAREDGPLAVEADDGDPEPGAGTGVTPCDATV